MPKIKPTATNRYRRWYDKLIKRHVKLKRWYIIDIISDQNENLKYAYESGYNQAIRDCNKAKGE